MEDFIVTSAVILIKMLGGKMPELRSITDRNLRIGDYLKLPWIFDRWYEKVILVLLGTLGLWKLANLII